MAATKRPATKYQPKGLTVLHEDRDIIVVEKPSGLLSIGTDRDKSRTVFVLNHPVRQSSQVRPLDQEPFR